MQLYGRRKNQLIQNHPKQIFFASLWSYFFCFSWPYTTALTLFQVQKSIRTPLRNTVTRKNVGITRIPISGRYSNMTISSLGCGTWSWGNRLLYNYDDKDDGELYKAYKIVRDGGVTLFDTADSYGTLNYNGRAEILLGTFERKYQQEILEQQSPPPRIKQQQQQQISMSWIPNWGKSNLQLQAIATADNNSRERQVATKLAPYPWRISRGSIAAACKGSLRRIQEDKVSIAQVHWSTANYQPFQERTLWESLGDLYDMKYCDAVGVSNYGPRQLLKIGSYLRNERNVPLATAQIQYSLLTYADPLTRDMESACSSENVQLIAYSPLCLGLLTGKYNIDNVNRIQSLPRRQLFRELLPGSTELIQTLTAIATERGKSVSQIALNWTLCKGTVPIPGCRTVEQARETIEAVGQKTGWRLSTSEIDELDRVALTVSKPMIQNVFQTK